MKAKWDPPQGRDLCVPVRYSDMVDDEFFHITCHVDSSLREKIEEGKFVELEKLLIKDRPFTKAGSAADNRMGLFTKDGVAYFAPAGECDAKINNVCQWEQAFRVYTAIYSKANPNRVNEVWQYVHVINHAASGYQWSNVAEYDFTFRHLMGEYPDWSWDKTYLQGWNMIMRDVLPKEGHGHNSKKIVNRDNICWPFNKGKCSDPNCPKDHKCSYCGKWGHGMHICRKRKKGNKSDADKSGYGHRGDGNVTAATH